MSVKTGNEPKNEQMVTAYLTIRGVAKAIDFYKKAFGAVELMRNSAPDGKLIWHARIRIGNSVIMMSDEFPECAGALSPETLGGTTVTLHLYVDDVDSFYKRAVDAGAKATMPIENMFWGDRYGQVTDPFGHRWSIATPIEQLTPAQTRERAASQYT